MCALWPEDLEDEPGAVDDLAAEGPLARFRCCAGDKAQSMTTRSISSAFTCAASEILDFALADKDGRTDGVQRDAFRAHDRKIDGPSQADRLFTPRFGTAQRVVRFSRKARTNDQRAGDQARSLTFVRRFARPSKVSAPLRRPPRTW